MLPKLDSILSIDGLISVDGLMQAEGCVPRAEGGRLGSQHLMGTGFQVGTVEATVDADIGDAT